MITRINYISKELTLKIYIYTYSITAPPAPSFSAHYMYLSHNSSTEYISHELCRNFTDIAIRLYCSCADY